MSVENPYKSNCWGPKTKTKDPYKKSADEEWLSSITNSTHLKPGDFRKKQKTTDEMFKKLQLVIKKTSDN